MTINTWKVIPGGTSREGQKWEKGENIGCINQMITVRSPWINLTKKLRVMLLSNPKSHLPPTLKIWEYGVISKPFVIHWGLFQWYYRLNSTNGLPVWVKNLVQWEKSLGRELHLFGIKCLWRVRSQEVMAQGSGIEHQLYLESHCYSSDT